MNTFKASFTQDCLIAEFDKHQYRFTKYRILTEEKKPCFAIRMTLIGYLRDLYL